MLTSAIYFDLRLNGHALISSAYSYEPVHTNSAMRYIPSSGVWLIESLVFCVRSIDILLKSD